MAKFYNEYDLANLLARSLKFPALLPYAAYLQAWVNIVNNHSDGWPYWRAGSQAGCKLADLLVSAMDGATVTSAQWTRVIAGIKSVATRQAKYGNKIPVPVLW
jgi:hypothetical protein